jgi:hypothetical protein
MMIPVSLDLFYYTQLNNEKMMAFSDALLLEEW